MVNFVGARHASPLRGEKLEFRCSKVRDGCLLLTAPDCPNAIDIFERVSAKTFFLAPGNYGLNRRFFCQEKYSERKDSLHGSSTFETIRRFTGCCLAGKLKRPLPWMGAAGLSLVFEI
jgi:hypothetical protein